MKRVLRWMAWMVPVLLGVSLLGGLLERQLGRRGLQREVARLTAEGERLTLKDLRAPPLPEGSNVWRRLVALTNELDSLTGSVRELPLWRWASPGFLVSLAQVEDDAPRGTNAWSWAALKKDLLPRRDLIRQLLEILSLPDYDNEFGYQDGFFEMPPDTWVCMRIGDLLAAESAVGFHEGDAGRAFTGLQGLLRLIRHQRRQPLLIGQLARGASVTKALALTSHALQADSFSAADLARSQELWQRFDPIADFEAALVFERALTLSHFEILTTNVVRRREALEWPETTAEILDLDAPPAWERAAQRWVQEPLWPWLWPEHDALLSLRHWNRRIAVARALQRASWQDCAFEISALDVASGFLKDVDLPGVRPPTLRDGVRGRFSHGGPSIFPDHMFFRSAFLMETARQLATAALGIHRFRKEFGQYPEALDDLVPAQVTAIPRDPMSGQALRYQVRTRGFLLYSVGTDGENDGGSVRTDEGDPYRTPFDGKDWVFPRPAP